jgi:hypothetical protein
MQVGDILTPKEVAYIEAMENLIYMLAMGNMEIDMLEEAARELREMHQE